MVRFTEPLGAQYGVRAICGKGGFPDEAIEPMRSYGMVYFAIVGGAAALETTQIEEIEEVAWEELMPECLWKFRVKDFGPLTVGIDAHGNSLYHDVQAAAPGEAGGALCPPLTGSTSALQPRRRPHARHRQGPRPARIEDLLETAGDYIDIVKLGWGTAYVTHNLEQKLALYRSSRSPSSAAARSSRSSTRATSSTSTSAGSPSTASRTSRSPTARSTSRASASSS